jgi:hypothetical protein
VVIIPRTGPVRTPSRRSIRLSATAAALLAGLVLTGCGAGFTAETNQIYQPGPGITDRSSQVYALNMLVVTDGRGHGTLVGGLVNQQATDDTLVSAEITATEGKQPQTTIQSGTVTLPPHRLVQLADAGDVRVTGDLRPGVNLELTLRFHDAAPVTMQIPTVGQSDTFAKVPVGPVPPPTTPSHSEPSK